MKLSMKSSFLRCMFSGLASTISMNLRNWLRMFSSTSWYCFVHRFPSWFAAGLDGFCCEISSRARFTLPNSAFEFLMSSSSTWCSTTRMREPATPKMGLITAAADEMVATHSRTFTRPLSASLGHQISHCQPLVSRRKIVGQSYRLVHLKKKNRSQS